MNTVLLVAVLAITAFDVWQLRDGAHLAAYRRMTPAVLVESAAMVAVAVALVLAVSALDAPFLRWGWPTLIGASATNVWVVPATAGWPIAIPFLAALLFLLPEVTAFEERLFRRGTRGWRDGAVRSVAFGGAHLVAGVSVGAVLPLTVLGLWLTRHYLRGGVERSATYHLAYDATVVLVIAAQVLL